MRKLVASLYQMVPPSEHTLPEIARLVNEPQHRLIHLCEKGVIVPDIADARGRGASRRFSRRNVLEFAVALELRRMMLPVAVAGAVIRALRTFERHVAREIPSFTLPDGLRTPEAPDVRVVLSDGHALFFTVGRPSSPPKVFGPVDVSSLMSERTKAPRNLQQKPAGRVGSSDFGLPEGSRHTRVEVSVTRIAQDLPLS